MDQIFERLERLVKAWVNSGTSSSASYAGKTSGRSSGDADLDAAMAELDDFLDTSKTESERREAAERRREAERERQETERRRRRGSSAGGFEAAGRTQAVVEEAYRYLGLKAYAPFAEVKAAYKKLLFTYHPDRNSSSPELLKKATETSTRINSAFQIIEAYEEAKKQ